MLFPVNLHSCQLASRTARVASGTGSAKSESARRPSAWLDGEGSASCRVLPHRADEHGAHIAVCASFPRRVSPRRLCQRIDAELFVSDVEPLLGQASAPEVLRRADELRSRLGTAGFHGRLRASCACFLFFPRSVGLGPTASNANGAFTMAPSMLCHAQAMPSISSYSAKPRLHILTNAPDRFHLRKYLCTELALPYSLGKAFHWHPVRSTYTIASNTLRVSIGFRPPPGLRLYLRPCSRLGFGISGATRSQRSSDIVHDFSVLMAHSITTRPSGNQGLLFKDKL